MTRNLYLMRGIPGAGKSTWLKNNNLENLTVSIDNLRAMVSQKEYGDTPDTYEMLEYPRNIEGSVWELAYEIVNKRMLAGLTTFIDATHLFKRGGTKAFNKWLKLANKYGYRVTTITINEDLTLEQLKYQNANRDSYDVLPDSVIEDYYERLHNPEFKVPSRANPVSLRSDEDSKGLFRWHPTDVAKYKEIVFIGDVHGSMSPLEKLLPFEEHNLYIFMGDLFDRGIQNYEVAKFIDKHLNKPNVVILSGNHEERLVKYASDNGIQGRDFPKTIEDIKRGYTDDEIKTLFSRIVRKMQPLIWFNYQDTYVVATHAGISNALVDPREDPVILEPEHTFTRGSGGYEYDFDAKDDFWFINVHGHRNSFLHPIDHINKTNTSINLEQQVEFGGNLGVYRINLETGKRQAEYYPNEVHSPSLQPRDDLSMPQGFRRNLEQHRDIKERVMGNGLYAYNFTKRAFQKKLWDESTIQARGLIMDRSDHIVARGFKKFFTLGENEETTAEKVDLKLMGKHTVIQKKYNGFLLIASWSPQLDDVLFTTKGGIISGNYIDIAMTTFTPDEVNSVKDYLKGHKQESMLFEVVNTEKDPHLINDKTGVYLLDVIHNDVEGLSVYKDTNDTWAEQIGYPKYHVVERIPLGEIKQYKQSGVEGLANLKAPDSEGYVITNLDTGYKVKIKSQTYKARKILRNWLHAVKGHGINIEALKAYVSKKAEHNDYYTPYLDLIQTSIDKINGNVIYNEYTGDIDMIKTLEKENQ